MKKKGKILRIAILAFMVISLSLTTSHTLAYWAEPIIVTESIESSETITAGDWEQAFPYDSNYNDYEAGDLVTYNGRTYRALSGLANSLTPGSGWFWWLGWSRL
ncbi:hypothetical protein KHQ88_00980 [Mycoplasmatota bacterium]|nr:hypothetical protein KHQ88_00980 [Mycoplasmatota bacterium]